MDSRIRAAILRVRTPLVVAGQLALVAISYSLAFSLRFDGWIPDPYVQVFLQTLPWVVVIRGLTFIPFRLYQGLWRYAGIYDLQVLLAAVVTSSIVFAVYVWSPLGPVTFPRSVLVTDALLTTVLLGGVRMTRRLYVGFMGTGKHNRKVLVYGAGDAGEMIVREMRSNPDLGLRPLGFIDDNPSKVGRRIHGVRVLGTGKTLAKVIDDVEPTELLIAIPKLEPGALRTIVRELSQFNLPIKTLPNLRDIIDGTARVSAIRPLQLEDLLARVPVGLDPHPLTRLVRGQRVLVTGAGGSIGSELCRQILKLRPARLVMLERYENSLHAIRLELDDPAVVPVVGDVTDERLVADVFTTHRPALVFHAAAHKHVPLMEENPCEAIKNNVRGTRIVAEAAERSGAGRFILISTDKAANPSSIMGASKRVAELIVQAQGRGSSTAFAIVRFGNVLGSNGSVVPLFMEQIRRGGPVTVTHPEVRRFFMVIPEAVQLVLHAAAQATNSGTYVLDMGEQMKVVDVARNLIRLSGLVPDEDIEIVYTGLRPGEKLQEELSGAHENLLPSAVPKVFVVRGAPPERTALQPLVSELENLALSGERATTIDRLRALTGGVVSDTQSVSDGLPSPVGSRAPGQAEPAALSNVDDFLRRLCPRCRGLAHRSRARRFDQVVRKSFTPKRLFRCSSCGWRGWLLPLDTVTPQSIPFSTLPPPDLRALDAVSEAAIGTRREDRL